MAKKFIEVEYTGKVKDGDIFDTTSENVAKESGIHNPKGKYGPVTICLGEGHLIKGLENEIKDKDKGEYHIEISCDEAFGKRNSKLIQLIPTKKLTDNNIKPFPGLQLNIDNTIATIKSVSGGRTIVDFNHPLAGKDVEYDLKINREVKTDKEKILAILELEAKLAPEVEEKDDKITIKQIPKEAQEPIKKRLSEFIDKEITFTEDKSS